MIVNKKHTRLLLYRLNKRKNYQVWKGIVIDNFLEIESYEIREGLCIRLRKRKFLIQCNSKENALNEFDKRYEKKIKEGYKPWNQIEINKDL